MSCCFYRRTMPAAWHPYLGLPAVKASQVREAVKDRKMPCARKGGGRAVYRKPRPTDHVHPMLGVVAMGLSHAVFLVQVLHEWILRRVESMQKAAVPREWSLRPASACLRMLAGVIVDDLYIVGLESKEEVDSLLADAEPEYVRHGWVAKESKREPAALQGRKVVGET